MARDPPSFLPDHIRDVLKRKSTRDPMTRFPTKLHLLLSYTQDLPSYQEMVGLAWINETEFRMNKNTVANVMVIKTNTLNVNLHDLKFRNIGLDEEGWTRWTRSGFTRSFNGLVPNKVFSQSGAWALLKLERLTAEEQNLFQSECTRLWSEILKCNRDCPVPLRRAVPWLAEHLRCGEQPLDNACKVISTILCPRFNCAHFLFADFCQFMAQFGPERTVMLKIASLLGCSNATGQWLTFEKDQGHLKVPVAYFGAKCENCLTVCHGDGWVERLYQNPCVEAESGRYLIDDDGNTYQDWEEWFDDHPVSPPLKFGRDKTPWASEL
jgi:hypothetical protein